ncbi:MAG: hypothetical protein FJ109_13245 [Deltaproteobacteria bacterium]|nr:hypothetical protein [Deltaproteobacteria bacterium]
MKRSRMNLVLLVLGVAAAVASAGLLARVSGSQVMSESTAQFLGQVEKEAVVPLAELKGFGPVVLAPARWLAPVLGAESSCRLLSLVGLVLLAVLAFLHARALLGALPAVAVPLLFVLLPQVQQLLFEPNGGGWALLFLLGPALLFGLGGSLHEMPGRDGAGSGDGPEEKGGMGSVEDGGKGSAEQGGKGSAEQGGRQAQPGPAGVLLAAAGGLLAGGAVLVHPLGLWTSLAALLGLAVCRQRERGVSGKGMIRLSAVGLELAAALVGFLVVAGIGAKVVGAGKNELAAWLFGPFSSFHPPLSVAGTVYSEAVDGGPPLWASLYLLAARTPVLLLAASLAGSIAWVRRGGAFLSGPLSPILFSWLAVLTGSSLAGSPFFLTDLSLLVPLSLLPSFLAGALFSPLPMSASASQSASASPLPFFRLNRGILCALLLLLSVAWSGWQMRPYPAAFGSLLCGGTDRCNAGNDPWMEPVVDSSLVEVIPAEEKELVISPWGGRAQSAWSRLVPGPAGDGTGEARSKKRPDRQATRGARLKDGGPRRALIWRSGPTPASRLLLEACNPDDRMAILPPGTRRLWSVCR